MFRAWIRHVFGLDMPSRVQAYELRKAHNKGAIEGAIQAFEQIVKDSRR